MMESAMVAQLECNGGRYSTKWQEWNYQSMKYINYEWMIKMEVAAIYTLELPLLLWWTRDDGFWLFSRVENFKFYTYAHDGQLCVFTYSYVNVRAEKRTYDVSLAYSYDYLRTVLSLHIYVHEIFEVLSPSFFSKSFHPQVQINFHLLITSL